MRKLLLLSLATIVSAATFALTYQPTIPAKLFDVRSGNGVVDAGTTYPRATVIVFKDNASKDAVIDAFAAEYGYQATIADPANPGGAQIPNPKSKQQFMNDKITDFIRDIYKANKLKATEGAARRTAETAADAELPIKP